MTTTSATQLLAARKPWATTLLLGLILFFVYSLGAFWVERYSGSCMFVLPGFFYALVTVLAILKVQRFGVGVAVFLPCALVGLAMEYYMEWVTDRALLSLWGVLGWGLVYLGFGLAADLAYRLAPARWSERARAILTGAAIGGAFFFLVLLALTTFYDSTPDTGHLRYFQSGAPFSLPWLLVNGAFGGYAAYAIARKA